MYYRRGERRDFARRERFFEPVEQPGLFSWLWNWFPWLRQRERREWPYQWPYEQRGFYPRTLGSPYVDPSSGALVARAGNPQAWTNGRDWRIRGNGYGYNSGYGYGGNYGGFGRGRRHHRRSYWPQPMQPMQPGNWPGSTFDWAWR